MISLVFSKAYRALEPRFAAYLRRYLAEHHESCADWVSEISEPMFRQLVLDGLLRTFGLFAVFVAAIVTWAFADHPELAVEKLVIGIGAVSLGMLINWRKLGTQCVDREFLYRRLNGKWRWER